MTRINFEEQFAIYLFSYPETMNISSKLNEFLSFLKFNKVSLPYKFSFVSSIASLIPEMTLIENILIDFTANSLTESKQYQFQEFLKHQSNRHLESLYNTLILPNEFPAQSDAQMNKVSSLIKSLLFEGQFIFLEEPEADLDPETLSLFISALKCHIQDRPVNVFIFSRNFPLWMPHAHLLVERGNDYSFKVSVIERLSNWEEERAAFFASLAMEPLPEASPGLAFKNLPSPTKKKSAA